MPVNHALVNVQSKLVFPRSGVTFSAHTTRDIRDLPKIGLLAHSSTYCHIFAQVPRLYNGLVESGFGRRLFALLGLVDSPSLSGIDPHRAISEAGFQIADLGRLADIKEEIPERFSRQVVIVQDAFTSYFETQTVVDLFKLLKLLEFEPSLMPFHPNGKPLHVHGFLGWFKRLAASNASKLRLIDELGIPLIGLDPSMTMTYRSEYQGSRYRDSARSVGTRVYRETFGRGQSVYHTTGQAFPTPRALHRGDKCQGVPQPLETYFCDGRTLTGY